MWYDRFCMRNIGDDLAQDHNLHLKTTLMSEHCEKIILKLTRVRSLSLNLVMALGFNLRMKLPRFWV